MSTAFTGNRLITGTNKNGKTNFAVCEIDKWLAAFPDRVCYSNIKGLSQTTDRVEDLPSSLSWLDTPEGSLVVYDESDVFSFFNGGQKGLSDDPRVKELARSAHGNRSVWFITQDPMLLHHHVRKFMNQHCHLVRVAGMEASTVWLWNERAADKPEDFHEKQSADQQVYFFRKDLYSRYIGSTGGHDIKMRLPKKVIVVGSLALLGVGFVLWKIFSGGVFFLRDEVEGHAGTQKKEKSGLLPSFGSGAVDPSTGLPADQLTYLERFRPSVTFEPWSAPAFSQLAPTQVPDVLCAISGHPKTGPCNCYTEQVTLIEDIPDALCRKWTYHRPYNPFRPAPVLGASPSLPLPASTPLPTDSDSSLVFAPLPSPGSPPPVASLGVPGVLGSPQPSAAPSSLPR